jgi:DNA-binding Lrp family transcriptional regulator
MPAASCRARAPPTTPPARRDGPPGPVYKRPVRTAEQHGMRAIFVMIKCEMGQAYRVAREMADGIEELSEMHSVSGQYDLLGKFYLEANRDIGLFVVEKIQTVPGVKDTYTIQTFNAFSGAQG